MKRRFTEDSWRREPWFKALVGAFLSCKNDEQMTKFLRDIGTLSELQAWSERLEIARLLGRGFSYRQVSRMTGASTTTITRVAQFLENGEGGYRDFLQVHRHHDVRKRRALNEEEKREFSSIDQKLSSKNNIEPSTKGKNENKFETVTALQKYLQKS